MHLRGFEDFMFHNYNRYSKTKRIIGLINSPSFVHTLQILDMCTLGDAADINSEIKLLLHSLKRNECSSLCSILSFTCVKTRDKWGT